MKLVPFYFLTDFNDPSADRIRPLTWDEAIDRMIKNKDNLYNDPHFQYFLHNFRARYNNHLLTYNLDKNML